MLFCRIARVRIDTYMNSLALTNWTVNLGIANFNTQAAINAFIANVKTLCDPCVPRVHDMNEV